MTPTEKTYKMGIEDGFLLMKNIIEDKIFNLELSKERIMGKEKLSKRDREDAATILFAIETLKSLFKQTSNNDQQ